MAFLVKYQFFVQPYSLSCVQYLINFGFLCLKERYYVGRDMYEKNRDFVK